MTVEITAFFLAKLSTAVLLLSLRETKLQSRILYAVIGLIELQWIYSHVVIFA
ncbi:hypothetical protein BJ878DRAFT_511433 [Calycina marina]|uniref:Uncharacterized protein n=1 Tax=Calycina marina TaxID=1763456 RepID=A0A9P7Z0S9_9HELO|nr:hypothetical protein BJ878DRAFT_511433 [Calycina marina]